MPDMAPELDLVSDIKSAVTARLSEWRRTSDIAEIEFGTADDRFHAENLVWEELNRVRQDRLAVGDTPLEMDAENAILDRVLADLFGLGGLEVYLNDPTIEDIFINGHDRVFVSRAGCHGAENVPPIAESDEALIELVNRWAAQLGRTERRFDSANPRVDLQLPGGYRLHAIMEVTRRPSVTIRCPRTQGVTLVDLIDRGTLDSRLVHFLQAAVRARCNIIVAGGTGTGKTTLLRSLLYEIGSHERVVTIEDTSELGLAADHVNHPNVVEMETRDANIEGQGEITMRDLTRECLRMSPDRVVVGEVRGAEALYMLKAMGQGNDGSMCTVHADSARNVASRIRGYCAEDAGSLPVSVIDSFYRNAVDLVVHLTLLPDRTRVVASIVEVDKSIEDATHQTEIFGDSLDGPAKLVTRPSERLVQRLLRAGMPEQTLDPSARLPRPAGPYDETP